MALIAQWRPDIACDVQVISLQASIVDITVKCCVSTYEKSFSSFLRKATEPLLRQDETRSKRLSNNCLLMFPQHTSCLGLLYLCFLLLFLLGAGSGCSLTAVSYIMMQSLFKPPFFGLGESLFFPASSWVHCLLPRHKQRMAKKTISEMLLSRARVGSKGSPFSTLLCRYCTCSSKESCGN